VVLECKLLLLYIGHHVADLFSFLAQDLIELTVKLVLLVRVEQIVNTAGPLSPDLVLGDAEGTMNFPLQAGGLAQKKKGFQSLSIDLDACNGDGAAKKGPEVFSMGTPPAEKVKNHFIGTPTAEGILNAFLSFDCEDAAPPLDFNDCCRGDPMFKSLHSSESTKSLGSESTKSSRGQEADYDERPKIGDILEDEPESDEEEYVDDFEAESEDEAVDA